MGPHLPDVMVATTSAAHSGPITGEHNDRGTVPSMSRVALAVFLTAIAAACSTTQESPATEEPASDVDGTRATLSHVFDGDSIEVDIEGRAEEIRLVGINAPEADECFGERARGALVAYVDGESLVLVAGSDSDSDSDQYGRLLRYVYVGGENINGRLLADGNAVTLQGDHRYNEAFVEIGNLAADGSYGMWAANACGPPPPPGMSIVEVQHNPPGPDDEHLNDEYVRIMNGGNSVVELSGWTLRDESSQNRYLFGATTLASGSSVTVETGCGNDQPDTVHWCANRSVWSNGGDTVILQDTYGNIVDWWRYAGSR
jgi:endonuclease YncB( thermonuclease family)